MNQNKRQKIQAKLDCPSTPEPEKEVCRKILCKLTGFVANHSFISYRKINLRHICKQCENRFQHDNDNALYCDICLAAKRKEEEG